MAVGSFLSLSRLPASILFSGFDVLHVIKAGPGGGRRLITIYVPSQVRYPIGPPVSPHLSGFAAGCPREVGNGSGRRRFVQ